MGRSSKNWPTTNLNNYTPLPVQESLKVALNIPVDHDQISYSLKKGFETIEPRSDFDQKDAEYPLLCFDANFECGNLGGAEVLTQAEYNLEIRQDTNSNKYRLWYYFSVSNFIKNQITLFNITNFSKTKSLYKNGQSPLYKFGSSGNWKRLNPEHCWYTKNESDSASTLSFLFKFPDDNEFTEAMKENVTTPKMPFRNSSNHKFNTLFSSQYGNFEIYSPNLHHSENINVNTSINDKKIYFAYCYPYTFTRLQNFLSKICSCSKYSDILERELVSMTAKQRRVDLLTITSPSNFQKLIDIERKGRNGKEKKILSKSSEPKLTSVKSSNKKRTLSRNSAREPIRCKECGTIESNKQSFRLLPTTLATSLGICTLCNSSKIRRSFSQSNIIRHDQLMDTINDRLYNVDLNLHAKIKTMENITPSVNGSKITLSPAVTKLGKSKQNGKNGHFDKLNSHSLNRFHGSLSSLTDNKTTPVFNSHLTPTKPYLPIVFVSARVHPGETPSSFAMENFIKYLLSSEAKNLRKVTVFKIIPMLNPDGVFAGNYRTSTLGYDLNRCYVDPSAWAMPEIYGVRDIVEKYLSGERIKNKMPEKKEKGKGKRKKDCLSVSGSNIPHSVEMLREQLRIPPFKSKSSLDKSKKDRNYSNLSHLQPRLPKVIKPESRAKLELYIDIHGHSGLSNSFMYGNIYEDDVELSICQHILPNIFEKLSQDFSLNNTTFNNENCKSGSARRAFEDYKNLLCYTLEISMSHYFGKYNSDAIFYTEKRYNTIGTNLARAIEHYFCIRKPGRKSITRSSLSPSKSLVF